MVIYPENLIKTFNSFWYCVELFETSFTIYVKFPFYWACCNIQIVNFYGRLICSLPRIQYGRTRTGASSSEEERSRTVAFTIMKIQYKNPKNLYLLTP